MNKINITVTGFAGTGKSAIADILNEFLTSEGFGTAHVEHDSTNFRKRLTQVKKIQQLEYLKNNITIVIDEQQAKRTK